MLPILIIVVTAALGFLVGLGSAAILAGLTAMFCMMAAFGGTLVADLRLLSWFGPVLVLVTGGLRLLSASAPAVGIGLLVFVVFLSCLLPALGSRFVTVGLGLGMASVFGFGLRTVAVGAPVQVFGAPALAVVVVAGVRWLAGRRDPTGPLRIALADSLTGGSGPGQDGLAQKWLADHPRRWTTDVLTGNQRYRNAADLLRSRRRFLAAPIAGDIDRQLEAAAAEADRLAGTLREAAPEEPPAPVRRREAGASAFPGATRQLVNSMWQGLEMIRGALVGRDDSRVDLPAHLGRELLFGEVRGALNWQSARLRHAIRCALGMLVALLVVSRRPTDPFAVSFLMATFAIMQPQWRDTLTKVWQRVAGSLLGAMVLALAIWLLEVPQGVLVGAGVVALLVGFYFMQTQPVIGNAGTVFMSIAVNSSVRHLDARGALLEYLGLILLAAVIGLVFGFAAIPGVRSPGLAQRLGTAVEAQRELLRSVSATLHSRTLDRGALSRRFRAASGAQQNLLATAPGGPAEGEDERVIAESAAEGLRSLTATASALVLRGHTAGPLIGAIGEVTRQLGPTAEPEPELVNRLLPARVDAEQRLLVDTMIADLLAVHRASDALRADPAPLAG
jgi:hypothetical protein